MHDSNYNLLPFTLILKLEAITYFQNVPFGALFVIIAAGFKDKGILFFFIGVAIGVVFTLWAPIIRYYSIKKLIESYRTLDSKSNEKINDLKIKFLNFPFFVAKLTVAEWAVGVSTACLTTNYLYPLDYFQNITYLLLYLMIIGINSISHFFIVEKNISAILKNDIFKTDLIDIDEIKVFSFKYRCLLTIFSIVIFPVIPLATFLLNQSLDKIDASFIYPILFTFSICLMIIIYNTTSIFISSVSENIKILLELISKLSTGKLMRRMSQISSDEFNEVSYHMNKFLQNINDLINVIKNQSINVKEQSLNLLKNSNTFFDILENQTSSIEEIASSIEEVHSASSQISNKIKHNQSNINNSKILLNNLKGAINNIENAMLTNLDVFKSLNQASVSGKETVIETKLHMDKIQSSSEDMQTVLNTIDEIADKIALLSLNASIEAARAGSSGSGFAVVATEMGKLGTMTLENAKKVKELINDSHDLITKGNLLIDKTTREFLNIKDLISKSSSHFSNISDRLNSQSEIEAELTNSFEEISSLSLEILNATSEQNLALEEMSKSVSILNDNNDTVTSAYQEIEILSKELDANSEKMNSKLLFFSS